MFREMRRFKQQVSQDECKKILKDEKRAAFSVIDDEVDTDKIEEMLDNAMYIEEYQDFYCSKGIKYMVDCDGSFIDISMSPEK